MANGDGTLLEWAQGSPYLRLVVHW